MKKIIMLFLTSCCALAQCGCTTTTNVTTTTFTTNFIPVVTVEKKVVEEEVKSCGKDVKVTIYICGRCNKQFVPTDQRPYCPCVEQVEHRKVVVVNPPQPQVYHFQQQSVTTIVTEQNPFMVQVPVLVQEQPPVNYGVPPGGWPRYIPDNSGNVYGQYNYGMRLTPLYHW